MAATRTETGVFFSLRLSPSGRVHPSRVETFGHVLPRRQVERIEEAFAGGMGHGLLHLGAEAATAVLGPSVGFWRDIARLYFTKLCTIVDLDAEIGSGLTIPLAPDEVAAFVSAAPPMVGIEYLSEDPTAWIPSGGAPPCSGAEASRTRTPFRGGAPSRR